MQIPTKSGMKQVVLDKEASLQNVNAGKTATGFIPLGGTIYSLALYCEGAAGALTVAQMNNDIETIAVKISGKYVIEPVSPSFLFAHQKHNHDSDAGVSGVTNLPGVISIPILPHDLPTMTERGAYAWGTNDISSIEINVKIAAGAATITGIEPYSERTDEVRNFHSEPHIALRTFDRNTAATGNDEEPDLPKEPGTAYRRIFYSLGATPGVIADMTVKKNKVNIFGNIPANINKMLMQEWNDLIEQSGYYVIDFTRGKSSLSFESMDGVTDWRLIPNWSTAPGAYTIYCEMIEGLVAAVKK